MEGKQHSVLITRHWGAFVHPLLLWKSNMYYIFWMCVCSLRYPACNAHASYCYLWYIRDAQYFSTLSHKRQDFRIVIEHKMCLLVFATTVVWNIFHYVVYTVLVYQVIFYKLVWHFALTYTVKLNSYMFRWRPPPSSRQTTTIDKKTPLLGGVIFSYTHRFISRPLSTQNCLSQLPRMYWRGGLYRRVWRVR